MLSSQSFGQVTSCVLHVLLTDCKMQQMEQEMLEIEMDMMLEMEQNEQMALQLQVRNYVKEKKRRRPKRFQVRSWLTPERRVQFGYYDQLMVELRQEDTDTFRNFMRMPPEMFDELLDRVGPRLQKKFTNFRQPLCPGLKLALTLRHLASGDRYNSMRFQWRVPHNTISVVVRQVCQALIDEYVADVMPLPTEAEQWTRIADDFMDRWQIPNTLGALDGKHVACKCPTGSGSLYFNYKKYYSVVLLALVDADYKFIWADIGGRGAASDSQLWNMSDLKATIENTDENLLNLPAPRPVPHDNTDIPFFIIGDDAFALRPTLMKPYSHRKMTRPERIFNYRLSRGRRVVENAFGILANRFQVLLHTMQQQPATVRLIVTTCLILHNLMRIRYPTIHQNLLDREVDGEIIPGEWRIGLQMRDCVHVKGANRDNREGKKQRNLLKHWVNSPAGAVPWQDRSVPV